MSRYSGYTGRDVYVYEFWYPSLRPAQRLVVDTLAAAAAVLIPYVPAAVLAPMLLLAGWGEDTAEGAEMWGYLGLAEAEIVIDGTLITVIEYNFRLLLGIVEYQLNSRANLFYNVVALYPESPIPLHWRSNRWLADGFLAP